jgi:hypothetical protein
LTAEISSDTVLVYLSKEPNHEFRLHTDASDHGISAVITQVQDGKEQGVSYGSRQLHMVKKKLIATGKELLAVVSSTKQFRCYFYGRKFTLVSEN